MPCSVQETKVSETCAGQKLLTGLWTVLVLDGLKIMRFQNLFIFESVQFCMLKADIFLHKATIQSDNFLLGNWALSSLHSLGNCFCWSLFKTDDITFWQIGMFESNRGRAVIWGLLICSISHLLTSFPIGLIMENGTCISLSNCPCIYHGTAFPVGSKIEQECSNW